MQPVIEFAHIAQILIAIISVLIFRAGVKRESYLLKAAAAILVIAIFILCLFVFIISDI